MSLLTPLHSPFDVLVTAGWLNCMALEVQVYIQEDEEQNIHYKHLSVHRAASEEEALNLVSSTSVSLTCLEPLKSCMGTRT